MKVVHDYNMVIKVPEGMLRRIDEEVERGEYGNRSDFVRSAIRSYLEMIDRNNAARAANDAARGAADGQRGGGSELRSDRSE